MKTTQIKVNSEDDTKAFAEKLAAQLHGGETIGLTGGLGAGKTFLVRALVGYLAPHSAVSSPSYVLCNEYQSERFTIEHWDLYRTSRCPAELFEPITPKMIRLIEWIERVPELGNTADIVITIERSGEGTEEMGRVITVQERARLLN